MTEHAHNIPLYVCTTPSLSIPLRIEICCLHVLAIVNSAAVDIWVHVSFYGFRQGYPGVGSLDHIVVLFLVF